MKSILLLVLIVVGFSSCQKSTDDKVLIVMHSFVTAINNKDTDQLISITHADVFEYITKAELAKSIVGKFNRFIKIKKLNKVYGPYEANGKYYVLADFKFQKGKVLLKRKLVSAFVFISEDQEDWKIVPYEYEDLEYRFRKDIFEGDSSKYGPIPADIIQQMNNDYIPGSEN